jgi:hypothetical protein
MKQAEKLLRKESKNVLTGKYIRKEFKPYMTACRDSTGMILTEPPEIME